MQTSLAAATRRPSSHWQTGWIVLVALTAVLAIAVVGPLWGQWLSDPAMSHGPLIPVIAGILLWSNRNRLRDWSSADPAGLGALVFCALAFVAAVWADIEFLKPLAAIGCAAGVVWFLAGRSGLAAAIGPIGFLIFMIPWPTTLVDRVGFPLQLLSSAYAAMLAGLCGLRVQRDGVQVAVMPSHGTKPIYEMLVAQKCSGLTSLMVLLALGYLIAYRTEVKLGWRLIMVAIVVPLTLLVNTVRLTIILMVGANYSAAAAGWVHDHETPFLIGFCSLGLMALRAGLLAWTAKSTKADAVTLSEAVAYSSDRVTKDDAETPTSYRE